MDWSLERVRALRDAIICCRQIPSLQDEAVLSGNCSHSHEGDSRQNLGCGNPMLSTMHKLPQVLGLYTHRRNCKAWKGS